MKKTAKSLSGETLPDTPEAQSVRDLMNANLLSLFKNGKDFDMVMALALFRAMAKPRPIKKEGTTISLFSVHEDEARDLLIGACIKISQFERWAIKLRNHEFGQWENNTFSFYPGKEQ